MVWLAEEAEGGWSPPWVCLFTLVVRTSLVSPEGAARVATWRERQHETKNTACGSDAGSFQLFLSFMSCVYKMMEHRLRKDTRGTQNKINILYMKSFSHWLQHRHNYFYIKNWGHLQRMSVFSDCLFLSGRANNLYNSKSTRIMLSYAVNLSTSD